MAVINWLHLSDWHQGRTEYDRDVVRRALFDDIESRAAISPQLETLDFIFFTGDLANHGKREEYETAKNELLEPLREKTGLNKDRLFIVPGNHDINRADLKYVPLDLLKPFDNATVAQEWMAEGRERGKLLEPFKAYQDFIAEYGVLGFGAFGDSLCVQVKGKSIGIMGCNSALMCGRVRDDQGEVNDQSYLTVGERQIREPLRKIAVADLRIALIHHPFDWLKEFDRRQIEQLMKGQCHFILRGHEHFAQVEIARGTQGEYVHIPGGSTFDRRKASDPVYVNSYNFVSYDTDTGSGVVYLRCLNRHGDLWISDHETYKGGILPFVLPVASIAPSNKITASFTDAGNTSAGLSAQKNKGQQVDLTAIRETYLSYVCDRWANLELRGVMQTGKTDPIPLDEVYVSLSAERERKGKLMPLELTSDDEWSSDTKSPEADFEWTDKNNLIIRSKSALFDEITREKVELPQAFRENPHIVVLGDPGAGKTTLARFLLRQFALACRDNRAHVLVTPVMSAKTESQEYSDDYGEPHIPMLLRVADYAEALRYNGNLRLRQFLTHARGEANISDQEASILFDDALVSGNALVILDGLDEVAQTADRAAVARHIDDFVHGVGAKNRIVVTSRIGGYVGARLNAGFSLFTIRDMDFAQVERFVTRRVVAYDRAQTQAITEEAISKCAKDDIASILDAVQNNEGVKRLAVNPLLLTILCLIHRTGAKLPERRVDLYALASKTLLEDWRPAQTGQAECGVLMTEADRLLAPLACWMHSHTDRGLIRQEKALDLLHEFSAKRHKLEKNHPQVESEVESFWRRITYDTSVFVERSQGEYAFLHLTFEEYWAARYLVRDYSQAAKRLRERRNIARFEEVILLAIASQTEENATHLLRSAIWCREDEATEYGYIPSAYEKVLRRDLLMAANCIGDSAAVEPPLAREVAEELVAITLNLNSKAIPSFFVRNAQDTLVSLRSSDIGSQATALLIAKLEDVDSTIRTISAQTLGRIGKSDETIVNAILKLVEDENKEVRMAASFALSQVGQNSEIVINTLIAKTNDEDNDVRWINIFGLCQLKEKNETVISVLLIALHEKENIARIFAAQALGELARDNENISNELLTALRDRSSRVRASAAQALGRTGQSNEKVSNALLTALRDRSNVVRWAVAQALGQLGQGNEAVLNTLLTALRDRSNPVRWAVAQALGQAGKGNETVINALLKTLEDEDANVRGSVVQALRQTGKGNETVINALLKTLEDEDANVRGSVVQALGSIGQGSEKVSNALLTSLHDKEPFVRLFAAQSLGELQQENEVIADELLTILNDEDEDVRASAARALSQVGQGSEKVSNALLTALRDRSSHVRASAAQSLGRTGQSNEKVSNALLTALRDRSNYVRASAARALGQFGQGNEKIIDELILKMNSKDSDVQDAVAVSLKILIQKKEDGERTNFSI